MKIVFFGTKLWEEEYLRKKIQEQNIALDAIFEKSILSKEHMPSDVNFEIACVFVDSSVSRDVITALPNLKFIPTRSTGYDHIDLAAASERSIVVSTVPSYGENTVAEQAFGLLLSISRKIYQGYDQIRETGSFSFEALQGFDLKGKTIGVVGTGRIGWHSIKIAKGFDMNVIAYDPHPNEKLATDLGFVYKSFEDVLRESDVVTLHVPYMKETHHLINTQTLGLMKKSAVIINTSRGPVIDTEALVLALKAGQLGGAGLDVLEEEGVIKDELDFIAHGHPEEHNLKTILANHILFDMPNVIITPHNAFNTREALERILDTTVENIKAYLAGAPINLAK